VDQFVHRFDEMIDPVLLVDDADVADDESAIAL